ncbi:MAG: hypothetical protein A2W61_07955 [Deltaproteobacteria bacterium RIFCSPLOWO2_01_44_7]|nr:MAG: hypothetical protein A2712_10335 [Deltaproteobacteria bacterium RIFCSPHIGHO2_01_FULL_43_49]OGQ15506.1 MAG: hypothetical protein A3D22_10865 [Deltaproteobacteria bacterium RIFCSPHIGHO2_02_FULL_44_53]OGQ28448.1 MAG: hypothetical protein A3D98_03050 [Deltaproteobacteria bacterium RIFCSPHIGHO2_12_FULL_44_21]OGQ32312.1 MAG: hypothetical protein A2979_00710 [Deltaproteobacteria bacterium RIFCSPLOWO2_01_FULL_45_74]OGQ37675.1 MAG: hypothetical protein A2W61_07955 [Deltaproteobacteria bacterium 
MATRYGNQTKFFKTFGSTVKKLRLKASLTQEDMMDFGFSVRFYQRIEAGKPIHMKTVLKLADALSVSLKQFFAQF